MVSYFTILSLDFPWVSPLAIEYGHVLSCTVDLPIRDAMVFHGFSIAMLVSTGYVDPLVMTDIAMENGHL